MFDPKKMTQEGQQLFIKLKSEFEDWKTIEQVSIRQWKLHTTNWEQLVHVLLRGENSLQMQLNAAQQHPTTSLLAQAPTTGISL